MALHLDSRRTQCIPFVYEATSCSSATKDVETREKQTYRFLIQNRLKSFCFLRYGQLVALLSTGYIEAGTRFQDATSFQVRLK